MTVLCFLVAAIDGFDTAAIGYIAPALKASFEVAGPQLAPLFGAGLFGLMIGAVVFGPLADRVGRKAMQIAAVAFFGLASLASTWSTSIEMLTVFRFVTGLGLGCAMPNAITLTSEYVPEARRSFLTMAMFCGFTVGSALGGFAATQLIADHGWASVLVLGGAMPLVLAPVLFVALPESVRFLVLKRAPSTAVAAPRRGAAGWPRPAPRGLRLPPPPMGPRPRKRHRSSRAGIRRRPWFPPPPARPGTVDQQFWTA